MKTIISKLFSPLTILILLNVFLVFCEGILFAQTWTQLPTTGNPQQRVNTSSIYIESGNRMIMFGGRTSTENLNDVWSLDLNTNAWQNITPVSGPMPAPRFTQNALYDSLMNRMLIWSGQGVELYNDVWAFDLNSNSWQQLWSDGNVPDAPLKRYGTGAVFDPVNRRIVNFAGFTTSGRFEDTWYFQVDSMKWSDKTNSYHPELRCLHSAYLTHDKTQMIIYGGQHNGALADIWSLNLNSFVWTDLTPVIKPEGRWFSPVICTNSNKAVIFGGQNPDSILGGLWKFSIDSMKWDSVNQGSVKPSNRWGHTSVYIPASDKLVIFGGADPTYMNDTWMFTNIGSVGINNISTEIPKSFMLYQNYPNPFNPVTVIRYSLIGNRFVSLIVFDALGKEITTLVNDKQNTGSYEIEFEGTGLSSGVYFYKLSTNNYFETKKMFLLK